MPYSTRASAIFCLVFGLLGCATRPAPDAVQRYDLGPLAPAQPSAVAAAGAAPGARAARPALYLAEVAAPSALDSPALAYRLLYAQPQQPRAYALARWSMPVPELVQQRLRAHWGAQRAVLQPLQGVQAMEDAPWLRLEVEDFSQHFAQPTQAQAVVQLRATLSVWQGGVERLLAQRSFARNQPSTRADAVGAVQSLAQALDALAPQIDAWVQEHTPAR
ncbi:MAG: ABC-type transport auxiliary lipoprotein family protein [Rhodoferax sp.]